MVRTVFLSIVYSFLFLSSACSDVNRCLKDYVYSIEYSSGGGFTGILSGKTIHCNGHVIFWDKYPNSQVVITDSLELSNDQIKRFNDLVKEPAVINYQSEFSGNYVTYLVITLNGNLNSLSFNYSDLPKDMPGSIRNLLDTISTIHK